MKSYYVIYFDDKGHLHAKPHASKAEAFDYARTVDTSKSPLVVSSTMKGDLTAHDLRVIFREIDSLHLELLSSIDEDGMSPIAQTQLAVGLSLLQQAAYAVKLANYYQMRGE